MSSLPLISLLRNSTLIVGKAVSEANDKKQDDMDLKATIVIEHIIQASDVAHTMQHWHIQHLPPMERASSAVYNLRRYAHVENVPSPAAIKIHQRQLTTVIKIHHIDRHHDRYPATMDSMEPFSPTKGISR
jgi:hypothetical protein